MLDTHEVTNYKSTNLFRFYGLLICSNQIWAIQILDRLPCVFATGISFPLQIIFSLKYKYKNLNMELAGARWKVVTFQFKRLSSMRSTEYSASGSGSFTTSAISMFSLTLFISLFIVSLSIWLPRAKCTSHFFYYKE